VPAKPEDHRPQPEAVIILVTASWCLPCRPARTLLRELQARWGTRYRGLVLEDSPAWVLERLEVEEIPTWLCVIPDDRDAAVEEPSDDEREQEIAAPASSGSESGDADSPGTAPREATDRTHTPDHRDRHLVGEDPLGGAIALTGGWTELGRRIGAAPKLEIDAMLPPRRETFTGDDDAPATKG
jgi:thiol-disulfide isomerase/thioredoxin